VGKSGRGSEEKYSQPLPALEPPIIQPVVLCYNTDITKVKCQVDVVSKKTHRNLTNLNLSLQIKNGLLVDSCVVQRRLMKFSYYSASNEMLR
jgi:hypothetical protein